MSDLPKRVHLLEEGSREGFQFHREFVPTTRKLDLLRALAGTGLTTIQAVSFVSAKAVPGWADADEVAAALSPVPGVSFRGLWLNDRGLDRALIHRDRLDLSASLHVCPSKPFLKRNQNRTQAENLAAQRHHAIRCRDAGVAVGRLAVMAAFGCNFAGDISVAAVLNVLDDAHAIATETGIDVPVISLADTMGWATPDRVQRLVGAVRRRFPDREINLHLHDTRGLGLANAAAGLAMGVARFDSSVGGVGGCPFAGHEGAAGNVCTEDLVFLCEEMGVETRVDLNALIDASRLAAEIFGGSLPGKVAIGGSLRAVRARIAAVSA